MTVLLSSCDIPSGGPSLNLLLELVPNIPCRRRHLFQIFADGVLQIVRVCIPSLYQKSLKGGTVLGCVGVQFLR